MVSPPMDAGRDDLSTFMLFPRGSLVMQRHEGKR
jgi:hypothetical protein